MGNGRWQMVDGTVQRCSKPAEGCGDTLNYPSQPSKRLAPVSGEQAYQVQGSQPKDSAGWSAAKAGNNTTEGFTLRGRVQRREQLDDRRDTCA